MSFSFFIENKIDKILLEMAIKKLIHSIKQLNHQLDRHCRHNIWSKSLIKNPNEKNPLINFDEKFANFMMKNDRKYRDLAYLIEQQKNSLTILNKILNQEVINQDEQEFLMMIPKFKSFAVHYENVEAAEKKHEAAKKINFDNS